MRLNKLVLLFIFVLLLICTKTFSQQKLTKKNFIKDSLYIIRVKRVRPQFRIDNRSLFYRKEIINLRGFDAGVLLKEKFRLTLGFYRINTVYKNYFTEDFVIYNANYKTNYIAINTEFIYYNKRFLSLGMPLEFGFGNNSLNYINANTNELFKKQKGIILLADFGLSATFKPIRWFGIKAVVGYRKILFNELKDLKNDVFFTSVGLIVDIREILKDVQLFRLKKKYKRNKNSIDTAVDLITN